MQTHTGRTSRNLQDTTIAAQLLYVQPADWAARLRRQEDFYQESALVWLEADVLIRKLSAGRRSLDDFCRRFYGAPGGPPQVRPYDFEELVSTLTAVQPHDWRKFWTDRLQRHDATGLDQGVLQSGWKLTFEAGPAVMHRAHEAEDRDANLQYSLGFSVDDDGVLSNIIPDSPADKSLLAPGDRIFVVNDRKWSMDELRDALGLTAKSSEGVKLLVQRGDIYKQVEVAYTGGAREPVLRPVAGTTDLLSRIAAPRACKAHDAACSNSH